MYYVKTYANKPLIIVFVNYYAVYKNKSIIVCICEICYLHLFRNQITTITKDKMINRL